MKRFAYKINRTVGSEGERRFEEVVGNYAFPMFNHDFCIHNGVSGWEVSEHSSGAMVYRGNTRKDTIKEASVHVFNMDAEVVRVGSEFFKQQYGLANEPLTEEEKDGKQY